MRDRVALVGNVNNPVTLLGGGPEQVGRSVWGAGGGGEVDRTGVRRAAHHAGRESAGDTTGGAGMVRQSRIGPGFRARYGIIADDLTGACDTGVQFARCGFLTVVQIARGWPREPAEVTVLSTDSRADSPATGAPQGA